MGEPNEYPRSSSSAVIAKHGENKGPAPCDSLRGEYVENILFSSLEANPFSTAGYVLWQTKILRHKLQEEQRGCYGHVESNHFHLQMLDKLEERGRVLTANLREMAKSMGASYRSESENDGAFEVNSVVCVNEQDEKLESAREAKIEDYPSEALLVAPQCDTLSPQQGLNNLHEEPLPKKVRVEEKGVKLSEVGNSSNPKSALARLVAQARAKERQEGGESSMPDPSKSGKSHDKMAAFGGNAIEPATSSSLMSEGHHNTAHPDASHKTALGLDEEDTDDEDFAVHLPPLDTQSQLARPGDITHDALERGSGATDKHPSQMTREEFLSQYKRAPRRGEIGQNADQIAHAEELGYVMSGSQSKASQMYVDRIQRQLHEREAARLHQQFREVEDKLMDQELIHNLLDIIHAKKSVPS